MKWFRKKVAPKQVARKSTPKQAEVTPRRGIFSTDILLGDVAAKDRKALIARQQNALRASFQRGIENLVPVDAQGNRLQQRVSAGDGKGEVLTEMVAAMDEAYPDLSTQKLLNVTGGFMPIQQLEWYALQGFLGWQTCAVIAQNWLVDKACTMPAQDAIRHWFEIAVDDSEGVDKKALELLKKIDKKMHLKRQAREFVKNGRIFGIRHALYVVEGIDYAAPFNPDGVKPNSYKGITQIDPYWISPILDDRAASNPAAQDFYEPTWWQINGKRVHRSHLCIMRNGDTVPDILKPSYYYGGIPIPQKIFERVYAAERTANEAPILAMTKRLTAMKVDTTQGIANFQQLMQKMQNWSEMMNNMGIKIYGIDEDIKQFDTSLADFDDTVMTQYQLVAAAANVPATKLLGTTPKGFNSSGEYEETSYHEELESIQEHDLTPLIEGHHLRAIRSYVAPMLSINPFTTEIAWKPVDSPTAEELAELNLKKAQTGAALAATGAIDGFDERQRISNDPDSGYNGIPEIVPDGPGDREAQQEAEGALEAPVNAKAKAVKETEAAAGGDNEGGDE